MSGLSMTTTDEGDNLRVALSGEITETSDFATILASKANAITIDLSEVRRMNSPGVREWMHFVSSLSKSGRPFSLEKCSVAIVYQLNMVRNFCGSGVVRSVLAPYNCAKCERQHLEPLDVSSPPVAIPASHPCSQCGGNMEFDDIAESYLEFMD